MTLPLFRHQAEHLAQHRTAPDWGLLWEQGTAKTRAIIETAAADYRDGVIDAVAVISDDGVHVNWADTEIPSWMPPDVPYSVAVYHSSKAETKTQQKALAGLLTAPGLSWMCLSHAGAFLSRAGKTALWHFLKGRKVMMVFDESIVYKTPGARLTIAARKAARFAVKRRILNGTPVDRSPTDVYSQIEILSPDYWRDTIDVGSFTAFQSKFCQFKMEKRFIRTNPVTGEDIFRHYPVVKGYRDLDVLSTALAGITDRVLKEDVLDLPPKHYAWRYFEMSPEQDRIYRKFRAEMRVGLGDEIQCPECLGSGQDHEDDCLVCHGHGSIFDSTMKTDNPAIRLLRLQQVLQGYQVADGQPVEDIPGPNRRLEALESVLIQSAGPTIVWARFHRDIDKIRDLAAGLNLSCGHWDGRTDPDEKSRFRQAFQAGDLDLFVVNQAAGSKGWTATTARHSIYYSNTFRLIHREQSEDRVHRAGLNHTAHYTDIACPGTIDLDVIKNLRQKKDVASMVTGDRLREWLA